MHPVECTSSYIICLSYIHDLAFPKTFPCWLSLETPLLFEEGPSTPLWLVCFPQDLGWLTPFPLCSLLSASEAWDGLLFPGSLVLWLSDSSTVRRLGKRRRQGKLVSWNSVIPFLLGAMGSGWVPLYLAPTAVKQSLSFGHSSFWVPISPLSPSAPPGLWVVVDYHCGWSLVSTRVQIAPLSSSL